MDIAQVDWAQAWFAPWRERGQRIDLAWRARGDLAWALNQGRGPSAVPHFVSQDHLPVELAYEDFIGRSGQCPVREGLHDFFNGLCWIQWPQTKRHFNQMQTNEIARRGVGPHRGPVRDAITVFDENGALLQAPQALWDALVAKDWWKAFVDLRALWMQAHLLLFGHALLEKLVTPRKAIVAHVLRLDADVCALAAHGANSMAADTWLAAQLTPERLALKPFVPVPVLGVPGWCLSNEDPAFYRDASVFRLPRPQAGLDF